MDKGDAIDLNNLKISGYYGYNKDIPGAANSPIDNGIVVVMNTGENQTSAYGGNGILQLAFDVLNRHLYIRAYWISAWGSWVQLN